MTTHILFDKFAYVDRLRQAGVDEALARAHGDGLEQALREEVATKSDLKDVEVALRSDLKGVEIALRSEIVAVRSEIKDVKTELKAEIAALKSELLKLMLYQTAALISILGGLGAIFKFL